MASDAVPGWTERRMQSFAGEFGKMLRGSDSAFRRLLLGLRLTGARRDELPDCCRSPTCRTASSRDDGRSGPEPGSRGNRHV
jgi:hypothetical protein